MYFLTRYLFSCKFNNKKDIEMKKESESLNISDQYLFIFWSYFEDLNFKKQKKFSILEV